MRIIYISNATLPSRAGNSFQTMRMCEAFAQNGHSVTLLYQHKGLIDTAKKEEEIHNFYDTEPIFSVRPLPLLNEPLGFFQHLLRLRTVLAQEKPDLVFGRFLEGCFVAALLGTPTIYESHLPISQKSFVQRLWFFVLVQLGAFKRLVVISDALKKVYKGRLDEKKILVAPDGAVPPKSLTTRARLNGRPGILQVGFVGNLYEGKGMEIIEQVVPRLPDVNFHIIGGMEKELAYWKNEIKEENIYFYGFVPQMDLSSYINALDVCLLPIQQTVRPHGKNLNIGSYTSPLKLFEYMAHKKAVVASDVPVLREVLNETNSILVSYSDASTWIQAIQILEDKTKREHLGEQAQKDFVANYSWDKRAEAVLSGLF